MKRLFICLLIVAFYSSANSQITEEKMIHFALEQYIKSHFDTTSEQLVFIEVLNGNKKCSFKYGEIKVILFDTRKEKYYLKKAIKKSNGLFYTLSIKQLSNDTIDFIICKCYVNKVGKYFHILMESGGDTGYLPFARFVYNVQEEKWFYYSVQELMKGVSFETIKLGLETGVGLEGKAMAN